MRRGRYSQRFDLDSAVGTQPDENDLILLWIDDFLQACFQTHEIQRRDSAQENGQLPTTAKILARPGYMAETLRVANVVGDYVGFHPQLSTNDEALIRRHVAANVGRK